MRLTLFALLVALATPLAAATPELLHELRNATDGLRRLDG